MFIQLIVSILIVQIWAQYPPGVPPRSYRQNVQNDNFHYQNDQSQKHYQSQSQHQRQQQQQQQRGPLFDEKYLSAEKDHIGVHLNAEYDSKSMTDDEFVFLQFKTMDSDNSNHIDGLEIYKAIYHALKENSTAHYRLLNQEMESKTDEFLKDCSNPQWNNGFITYNDFKRCIAKANRQRA